LDRIPNKPWHNLEYASKNVAVLGVSKVKGSASTFFNASADAHREARVGPGDATPLESDQV
jgi:hypothetical protein